MYSVVGKCYVGTCYVGACYMLRWCVLNVTLVRVTCYVRGLISCLDVTPTTAVSRMNIDFSSVSY